MKSFSSKKCSWLVFLSVLLTVVSLFIKSVQAQDFFIKERGKTEDHQLREALWNDSDMKIISILLDGRVDLSFHAEIKGWTHLHIAAQETSYPEVITALISEGADPHALDDMGNSPFLLSAAFNKNPEVVRTLAEYSNVNLVDKKGLNALHLALMHNQNLRVIMVLEKYGVDPLLKDSMGRTPLMIAEGNNNIRREVVTYMQGSVGFREIQRNGRCPDLVKKLSNGN